MCATYSKGNTGKIQVSTKKEMKLKIKESPDLADAVLFSFAPLGENDLMSNYNLEFDTFKKSSWG